MATALAIFLHQPFCTAILDPLQTFLLARMQTMLASEDITASTKGPPSPPEIEVVLIGSTRHEQYYRGRTPLARDELLSDLQPLLDSGISTIAVDLDISPTPKWLNAELNVDQRKGEENKKEKEAEARLYKAIHEAGNRVVLVVPFPVAESGLRTEKAKWMSDMCEKSVMFADPVIVSTYGILNTEHDVPSFTMGRVLRSRIDGTATASGPTLCNLLTAEPHLFEAVLDPDTNSQTLDKLAIAGCARDSSGCSPRLLAFHQAYPRVQVTEWGPGQMPVRNAGTKAIILAADYNAADRFVTPLGLLPGGVVHGVAALPQSGGHSKWVDRLADIVLGALFGWLMHRIWSNYFSNIAAHSSEHSQHGIALNKSEHLKNIVTVLRMLFVLTAVGAMILLTLLLSYVLFRAFGWRLSAIPIAAAMAVDGLMLASWSVAKHQIAEVRSRAQTVPVSTPV